jgi:hypothetical protein
MQKNGKPGAANAGHQHQKLQITGFRPLSKNTLRAVFSVLLPSGLEIHGVMLHEVLGQRWIGWPGKPYTKTSGKQTYVRIIDFHSGEIADRYRDAVLAALDEHLREAQK